MIALLPALLLSLTASSSSTSTTAVAPPARVTIVVGYDGDGSGARPVLAYADDDAARLYLAALQDSERAWLLTTFDDDSARVFPELTRTARAPTKAELGRVLGEAFWQLRAWHDAGRPTELVFSFAGHGDVSAAGEGFLVFADGALTRGELGAQIVRASPADVNHVLIDACASYFMVNARGETTAPAVSLSPALLELVRPPVDDAAAWARTGTLVSTSGAVAVHESSALGSGVFSYLLRSALAGPGDTDGDGDIEYGEAAAFIAAASASIDDPRARLQVHARAPSQRPHVALSDLRIGEGRRFLDVDVAAVDHVRVLDQHGLPYVELRRGTRGKAVTIALHGSAFYVVQVGTREATLVPRTAGAYALSSLRFEDSPRARGPDGAFAGLYETPFDESFVQGFLATSSSPAPLAGEAFTVSWATSGAPPLRPPWGAMTTGAFVAAATLTTAASVSAVMNLVTFAELQRRFERTATIDPELALSVEGWRTTATITGAGAVGAVVLGAGTWWLAHEQEQP